MITYDKLWILLTEKGLKRTDLLNVVSSNTLAKLGKNASITTDTLDRLCEYLKCKPYDIIDYISEKELEENAKKAEDTVNNILSLMENVTGLSIDEILSKSPEAVEQYKNYIKNGKIDLSGMLEDTKKFDKE